MRRTEVDEFGPDSRLIRRWVVVEGPDVALSGRGAEPGSCPSPPLSEVRGAETGTANADILDIATCPAPCADPSPFGGYSCTRAAAHDGNHVSPNGSNLFVGFVAWLDGEQWVPGHPESKRRTAAPGPVGDPPAFGAELRACSYCGVSYPRPVNRNHTNAECAENRTAAPPVLGDPLSWFQEQRDSLKRHEYDGAVHSDSGVADASGSLALGNVVSMAEYRTRP